MSEMPTMQWAAKFADVIAHKFTTRPMTQSEARDFAEVLRCAPGIEAAADVLDAWNALPDFVRARMRRTTPALAGALDRMAKEDRS